MNIYKVLIKYGSNSKRVVVYCESEEVAVIRAKARFQLYIDSNLSPEMHNSMVVQDVWIVEGKLRYRMQYQFPYMEQPSHVSFLANDMDDAMDEGLAEIFRWHGSVGVGGHPGVPPKILEIKEI